MKNIKFVVAKRTEKYTKEIVGILLSSTKDKVSILGVDSSDQDDVEVYDLETKLFKISPEQKDRVEHHFNCAILKLQNDLNLAEIELRNSKRILNYAQVNFKKYFNKEVERI